MELLLNLLEDAKKDKNKLIALKQMAIKLGHYELAATLREMELELFPETDEIILEKERAKEIQSIFQMVGLDIPAHFCWLITNTLKLYSEKKNKFNIADASELIQKQKTLFDIE